MSKIKIDAKMSVAIKQDAVLLNDKKNVAKRYKIIFLIFYEHNDNLLSGNGKPIRHKYINAIY